MAFKLTVKQQKERAELEKSLRAALDELMASAEKFCLLRDKANEFIDNIHTSMSEEFDGKSERWQGSDNGDRARSFVEEWEFRFTDSDASDLIAPFPDEVETFEAVNNTSQED